MTAIIQQKLNKTAGAGFNPDPAFLYFDGYRQHDLDRMGAAHPYPALSEAERNRLVKAAKSPTRNETPKKRDLSTFEPIVEMPPYNESEPERRARQFTVVQERGWSDEFRIRTRTETPFAMPPEQWGDRVSEILSDRGARKIADSCHYMALQKGGYRTFITGTFDEEARARIKRRKARPALCREQFPISSPEGSIIKEAHSPVGFEDGIYTPLEWYWESGIQAEVTRCMDAINKMYVRGFMKSNGEYVPSSAPVIGRKVGAVTQGRQGLYTPVTYLRESLCYCWVVEIPPNSKGEENPHVHIMMSWQIDKEHWSDWSDRLENDIWGNGYFHLEKLKTPEHAGAYMAKAAGYMSKGAEDNSQGIVRGNRYGISNPARAPEWCTVGEFEMGIMGRLLAEISETMTQRHGDKYAERKRLNKALEDTPKKFKSLRKKIGQKLAKVREEVNKIPVRASKYQLVIKDKRFLPKLWGWVTGQGWQPDERPSSQWLDEFTKRQYARRKRREQKARLVWTHEKWFAFRGVYEQEASVIDEPIDSNPVWDEYNSMAFQ